jgi:hypothetical protein
MIYELSNICKLFQILFFTTTNANIWEIIVGCLWRDKIENKTIAVRARHAVKTYASFFRWTFWINPNNQPRWALRSAAWKHVCSTHWIILTHYKWVPVTRLWRVLRLRMEERHPIWRVAANILNKQSRTTDRGWSSILGVVRGANNSSS